MSWEIDVSIMMVWIYCFTKEMVGKECKIIMFEQGALKISLGGFHSE